MNGRANAWVCLYVNEGVCVCACVCTAWCSEIGSLWSPDAPELHASVMSEYQFHCTRLYVRVYVRVCVCHNEKKVPDKWQARQVMPVIL